MEPKRDAHQRSNVFKLYHAGGNDFGEWGSVHRRGQQFGRQCHQCARHAHSHNAAPVAPSITTQPANQTVFAGQTATFSVIANGTLPLSYQWKKNGTAISGATSASYTTPAETTSDNGAQFSVVVSNSAGTVTSNAATLTVNPDPVAPSHHEPARKRDDHRRADGHVLCHRNRHSTTQLSVEPERDGHQRSDFFELHHAGGNDFGEWGSVHRGGQQFGRQRPPATPPS